MSMKMKEFLGILHDGVKPVIEFRKGIEGLEDYAEHGMRAKVVGGFEHWDNLAKIKVDFSDFEKFNEQFERPNYYDAKGVARLTAREAGHYKAVDTYYLDMDQDTEEYFSISEDCFKLYNLYRSSKTEKSYTQWLEELASVAIINGLRT